MSINLYLFIIKNTLQLSFLNPRTYEKKVN